MRQEQTGQGFVRRAYGGLGAREQGEASARHTAPKPGACCGAEEEGDLVRCGAQATTGGGRGAVHCLAREAALAWGHGGRRCAVM